MTNNIYKFIDEFLILPNGWSLEIKTDPMSGDIVLELLKGNNQLFLIITREAVEDMKVKHIQKQLRGLSWALFALDGNFLKVRVKQNIDEPAYERVEIGPDGVMRAAKEKAGKLW